MRKYLTRNVTRALTRTGGFLESFAFSLNPYIGCAFGDRGGCPYCYVRALPVARSVDSGWGSWVIAKVNLPELLRQELKTLAQRGKLGRTAIFMSSATDPYQGLERRLQVTRRALQEMVANPPFRLLVQTRSPIIERDLDLLCRLGERVIVSVTIETDDDAVRRMFTPTSPSIVRRLATARRLRQAGIFTQIAVAPMLPNNPERLATICEAANRVIIDTYFDGDGSGSRRSRALGMAELYQRLGFSEWFRPGAEQDLLAAVRQRLGTDRVLFSREGFNTI